MTREEAQEMFKANYDAIHAGLTPEQREFIESTTRHTMIAGGYGMGKAFILRNAIIELALYNPGIKIGVFAKDLYSLNENIGKHLIYGGIHQLKWPKRMTAQNGSSIYFMSGWDLKSIQKYAGMEFDVIALYEAQNIAEDERDYLETMILRSRMDGMPRMLYTASTGGVGYQWIKRLFIDRKYKEREKASDYCFIKATINQSMFETANAETKKRMQEMLTGAWDPTEGEQ